MRINLVVSNTIVRISKCSFVNNYATKYGGAVFVRSNADVDGRVYIKYSVFTNNVATKSGQALHVDDHTGQLRNINITSNSTHLADHLYAVGRQNMIARDVSISLLDSRYIRSAMSMNVVTLKSRRGITWLNRVKYECPAHSNAKLDQDFRYQALRKQGRRVMHRFITSYEGTCETCRSDHYSLAKGMHFFMFQ